MKFLWYSKIHIFPICSSVFLNLSAVFYNFPCGSFGHCLLSLCLGVSVIMFNFESSILFKLFLFRYLHIIDIKCIPFLYVNSFFKVLSSVQFSHSVVSNSLQLHGLQHGRLPCPSPTPRVYSNSCPSSWWCQPTISSSVVPFSSCLQYFSASGSSQMSQFFASGGQTIGVSASTSVLPMNIQDWFPLGWTGWISLQSKGLSRVFSNTTAQKHQFFSAQLSLQSNSHIHTWLLEKP